MRLLPTNKVSTGNAERMSATENLWDHRNSVQEGAVKQRNVKAWKATHFRSETESLLNKNRSRCGHTSTVTGKGSLEDPLRCEDSSRVDQLNYFEKVLENSMATSEERLEQLRRVGSRATRRMATATGSPAAVKGWTATHRSFFRSTVHDRSPSSFVPRITSNAKREGEVLVEAFNASRSMRVMGANLQVQCENSMWCDKPSATNLGSSTKVPLHEVTQDRRCISPGSTLGVSAGQGVVEE